MWRTLPHLYLQPVFWLIVTTTCSTVRVGWPLLSEILLVSEGDIFQNVPFVCRIFPPPLCFSLISPLRSLSSSVTLFSAHLAFPPPSLHRFKRTHNYPTVSLPLSRVCRWGQSLGFLSSSNTAVLHHDCNSSSVCNPRPAATQVIRPPPRHDNSARSHAQAHVTRSVICCGTRDGSDPTLGTGFTDHQTGRNAA